MKTKLKQFSIISLTVLTLLTVLCSTFLTTTKIEASGTISGRIFQDFNGNGNYDSSGASPNFAVDAGVSGVTVTVYDGAGTARGSATSAVTTGLYSITATGTGPYRVEFTTLPTGFYPSAHATDSVSGGTATDSGSTVQFVADGNTSNVNLAINKPELYTNNNPLLMSPVYTNGDNTGTNNALVALNFDRSGSLQVVATANQIGTTWGVAWRKKDKKIFAAAALKRHSALGPGKDNARGTADDLRTIYTLDYPNLNGAAIVNSAQSIDVGSFAGVDLGTNPRLTSSPANDLAGTTAANHDYGIFTQVARAGIGGIALSEDENTLYFVNLNAAQPQLVSLNITNLNSVSLISTVNIPNPGCPGTDSAAPWAVKVNSGNVYVGTVCTADVSQDYNNLRAYLLQLNGNTFTTVDLDSSSANTYIPLNYDRTYGFYRPAAGQLNGRAEWRPWLSSFPTDIDSNYFETYATPIFSDMEFAADGSLTIGLMDRTGHQIGYNNYSDNPTDTTSYLYVSAGDNLKVCRAGGSFIPERAGGCSQSIVQPRDIPDGTPATPLEINGIPNEFYDDNSSASNGAGHGEIFFGGLAAMPGSKLVGTALNPTGGFNAGGWRWLNTSTGTDDNDYKIYQNQTATGIDATFGKANGLGDIVLLSDAAPIEIGNRIWRDSDGDGIQDPGEAGIAGITVHLYDAAGNLIATAVTDSNGEYYFSSAAGTSTGSGIYNLNLLPNTDYSIRLDNPANYSAGNPLNGLFLSPPNTSYQAGFADGSDSDGVNTLNPTGSPTGTFPVISLTTGGAGANNHTYDFGFALSPTAAAVSVSGRVLDNHWNGIEGAQVTLISQDGTALTTLSDRSGFFTFEQVAGQTAIVTVAAKGRTFAEAHQFVGLTEDVEGLYFIANGPPRWIRPGIRGGF